MRLALAGTLGAAVLCAVPAAGRAAEPDAPLPGYWELANTWVFVFHFRSVERKCFTAADVANVMQGPSNGHYKCTYPSREVADGRLSMQGTCVETHGQVAQIAAHGVYGPTDFRLSADLRTKIAGIPLHGTGSTVAHRLADACPAPPPKPHRDG